MITMTEEFKFWFAIIASVFGSGVTAYISVQAGLWKANNRIALAERDIKYLHEANHELKGRITDLERE
jgi:cell division protein FtsB